MLMKHMSTKIKFKNLVCSRRIHTSNTDKKKKHFQEKYVQEFFNE